MGMPTGLQFSITAIGSMVMQSANNGLGSTYVSAFTAAMKIKQFTMCPFDAIAYLKVLLYRLSQLQVFSFFCGIAVGILLIFAGRTLSMLFVGKSAVAVLDASAKYLRCMGFFYWSLGILNVARMVTQGLGYSGRAVFSGVTEMIARTVVCLGFVGTFGFTAICFADQTAWITATCYIFPTCLWCIRKSTKMLASIAVRVNNAS